MNSLLKIVKESGINFSGSLVGMLLNYALLMIITRFLGPEEYGTFVLAQSIINVSLIFVLFGTPKALDRFIPFYNAAGEQGKIKTLIYGILKLALILSLSVGVICFIGSGFLSRFLFKNPSLPSVLQIMALSLPMLAFLQIVSSAFIGFKELRYQVYIRQLALPLLKVGFGVTVFILGYKLLGWTWAYVFSLVGSSVLAFWFFKRRISCMLSKVNKKAISFREIVSYSWPLSVNNIILIFLGQVGFLFLGYFRPSAEIGVYRIYIYLVSFLGLVLSSFAQIYKPVISELISKGKLEEVGRIYKRVSKWIFLINSLGFLVTVLFGPPIIKILFTKSYLVAPTALLILAAGSFLNSSFGPEGMTIEAFGNTKLSMLNAVIMLGINLALSYLLIPQYGIIGAAIATASSVTFGGLAGVIEIYLLYHLQPYTLQHLKYIVIAVTAGTAIYAITRSFTSLGVIGLLGFILLLMVMYLIGLYFSRSLDSLDYQVLSRAWARIVGIKRGK